MSFDSGVQGLGWYVLRHADPIPLIRFYRDALGLVQLRGRETPGSASAMLWGGGVTVFEPNCGGNPEELPGSIEQSPHIPVFRCGDVMAVAKKLMARGARSCADDSQASHIYLRDPAGFWLGLVRHGTMWRTHHELHSQMATQLDDRESMILPPDGSVQCHLEIRSSDPQGMAKFYQAVLRAPLARDPQNLTLLLVDGSAVSFLHGGCARPKPADREAVTTVPVFRCYGLNDVKLAAVKAGGRTVQEVSLRGGSIWYGLDPAGYLFGLQERYKPTPEIWQTNLPEDEIARRLWSARFAHVPAPQASRVSD